jgi:magnesium transporter
MPHIMRIFEITDRGLHERHESDLRELWRSETRGPVWVDMSGPSEAGVAMMRDVMKFHPLAIEDTVNKRQRPKIDDYGSYMFHILNPAILKDGQIELRELDVFVSRDFIVTVHQGEEPLINEVADMCINRHSIGKSVTTGYVMYVLLDKVVDSYFPIIDAIEEELEVIAEKVVRRPRQKSLQQLFEIRRSLAELFRVVGQQNDTLNVFMREQEEAFHDRTLGYYLRDVHDHLIRVNAMVAVLRETLMSVVDLYFSSQSNRLNTIVQRLTFSTIAIGILTVISGFYGMNFERTWPPFSADWGVAFALLMMGLGVSVVIWLARRSEKY